MMCFFTKNGIEDDNNKVLACINGELNIIKEKLGIDNTTIVSLKDDVAYFTLENILFGDVLGACRLLFKNNILVNITFAPNMKKYIVELKQVTRQGLYSCVYKAYNEINEYANSLKWICVESGEKKSIYKTEQLKISVVIDNTNESVCIIQEAVNE